MKTYILYINPSQSGLDVCITSKSYESDKEFYKDYSSKCKIMDRCQDGSSPLKLGVLIVNAIGNAVAYSDENESNNDIQDDKPIAENKKEVENKNAKLQADNHSGYEFGQGPKEA